MPKLFTKAAAIDLTLQLPPDGTYPPRLVFPGASLFLPQSPDPFDVDGRFYAQNMDGHCIIFQSNQTAETKVNNLPLVGQHVLKDGDFISNHNFKAIFQSDPVADYRQAWLATDAPKQAVVHPTKRVAKYVVINTEGLSLNGGKSFARWEAINLLMVRKVEFGWNLEVVAQLGAGSKLPSKPALKSAEMATILKMLEYHAPFRLSFHTNWHVPSYDAYTTLANDKIVTPWQNRQRVLPASPEYILNLSTRRQIVLSLIFLLVLHIIILGFALLSNVKSLELKFVIYAVLFAFFLPMTINVLRGSFVGWKTLQIYSKPDV